MNRTDELTDKLIDGTLADAEAIELHELLAADPGAQVRHLALVRLELVLRGLRTEFDFAEPTVAKIEAARVERTTTAVMTELAHLPTPARDGRATGRVRQWVAFATLTAATLGGVWFTLPPRAPVPNGGVPSPPEGNHPLARLTTISGTIEIAGPLGTFPAQPSQELGPGQTVRTVGEDSTAVVEFIDSARVVIHAGSVVQAGPADAWRKEYRKLLVVEGRVTATATGRRIVVGTGAADVETSRGSFALSSSGPGSARVESLDGDVRVVRGAPAESMLLDPGRTAFLRDEQTPVQVERTIRIDTAPRHRLNFMALDVGFAPDGEVFAASAKQWSRWRPGTPDPGRVTFPPKVSNDAVASWLTPDLRAVALCRVDDKEGRIVVRALPSGDERGRIPVGVSDPRFLSVAPDAAWVATAGGQKPNNRTVRVWNVGAGTERFARELRNGVNCLAASADGKWLAVGVSDLGKGTDNGIAVLDAATGDRAFELSTKRKGIMAVAFSADGKRLAAGFNGAVQVWDVLDRKLVRTLEGFERLVTRLAYSPQSNALAAGTQDGQVWVWSADTGRRRQVIETGTHSVRSVAFSTDGKLLITATNKAGVAVWEVTPEPAKDPDPDT